MLYKPRCLRVDRALDGMLERLLILDPPGTRIRVPEVLVRPGYGWAEFVDHRPCEGEAELTRFYRNLGHWLGVMRLLGGTDLHSENLIANGPVPVVVDVESLFMPDPPMPLSGRGLAVDRAAKAIRGTVLRTGLLPVRSAGPGLGGLDISAAGSLPGQQPFMSVPTIVGGGTDGAHLEMTLLERPRLKNHPSPEPVLARYWPQVVEGFHELTARLKALDAQGELRPLLEPFAGAVVRRILRPTQTYAELQRMLWHPASLHDARGANARARDVMRRNAEVAPGAPSSLPVIDEEIADLCSGDTPVFTVPVSRSLLDAAVTTWRSVDVALEELTIQGALVSAYLNEQALPPRVAAPATPSRRERLDSRRRAQLSGLMRRVCDSAVRGPDGSVTWISPVLAEFGWAVRPLSADLYSGQGGVAVCLAQYQHEVRHGPRGSGGRGGGDAGGRARGAAGHGGKGAGAAARWLLRARVPGVGLVHAARPGRGPRGPGAGLRARGGADPGGARRGPAAGGAGRRGGRHRPAAQPRGSDGRGAVAGRRGARGRRLEDTARSVAGDARWATSLFPEAIGGFAHGTVGIGWALARLGLSAAGSPADRRRWRSLAERAFDFVEGLYRPESGHWLDGRRPDATDQLTTWCHGSTGIGLAAADLSARTGDSRYLDLFQRARTAGVREGFGWTHTLCHGDLGLWELLEAGRRLAPDPQGPDREVLDAEVLAAWRRGAR